ncbi:chemokine XC receptor 1 isoform X2 [Esox lucius]|uniref:G-protein coupled receptors family 1 profile domain-containing protein n=2 Tax=Esox lucius TaxID=8010 RepID=A0AAY5KH32_ESOLU|nr:chemokine XC receptor 1 isoform X2 [Esox lucius]
MDQSGFWEHPLNDSYQNYTDEDYDGEGLVLLCEDINGLEPVTAAFFLIIFLFSVAGNVLMLVVLCRHGGRRRVTNLFILNLLTSDLLFTLTLPFWAVYNLSHWLFGDVACKLLTGVYFTGFYSSLLLLTSLTVDRFMTVVVNSWNAVPKWRLRCAWAACTASWVISFAASLHDVISAQVVEVHSENGIFNCEASTVPDEEERLGYYLQVSLLFLLPLTIIILCYSAILRKVLVTASRRPHRTILVVFLIVVAFFICWGPYNLVLFLQAMYKSDCDVRERLHVSYVVCRILAYAHCCVNPLLYLLSHSFRRHLWSLVCGGTGGEGQGEVRHGGEERSIRHSLSNFSPQPTGPGVMCQRIEGRNSAAWIHLRTLQECD